ncbi:MAG: flagellar biosynthesis protein FliQ [Lachnospiraceae bacterium]|nr:flagellar biosynthesis protein FliQ [Lachnospiraceae bacterium]
MTTAEVITIAKDALYTIIITATPILLISLVIGLVISIFQTVTSIQEQTMTFVPKIIGIFLGLMLLGGWMLENMVTYMEDLWSNFSLYIR